MIPQATARSVETNIPNSVHNAQIEVNGMAFKVLSANLYTDRILAIVRELACNAWDAHAMVNKTNVPFEVFLPSELKPELRIRDFGPGLSKEELPKVYTTFFGSTKRNSNDQIGGFGLGSKSPLSYTDAFSVTSFQNGVSCTYAIFLQKDGSPGVTLLDESDTDRPDGLEVTMPVEPRHNDEFITRARRALRYFPTMPRVLGAKIEARDYTIKSDLFGVYEGDRHGSAANIIMGHVAYPISRNALDDRTTSQFHHLLSNSNIDIFVPIGELEIQPSREALSYDDATKNKIHDLLEKVVAELSKTIQSSIDKQKTFPEAFTAYKNTRSNMSWNLFEGLSFKWRNRTLKEPHVKIRGPLDSLATINRHDWSRATLRLQFYSKQSIGDLDTLTVLWHDLENKPYLKQIRFNQVLLGTNVLVIRGDKTALRMILKQLGMRRFITLSQLPAPEKLSAVGIAKKAQFNTLDRSGALRTGRDWNISATELDKKEQEGDLVWVGTSSKTLLGHGGIGSRNLQNAISLVDDIYGTPVTIVAIPRGAKKLETVLSSHVLPYLHAQLDRYEIEHDVATLRANAARTVFSLQDEYTFLGITREYCKKHHRSVLADFHRAYNHQPRLEVGQVITYLRACEALGRIPVRAGHVLRTNDVAQLHKKVIERYPLLPVMADRFWGRHDNLNKNVTQYLEAIDNEQTLLHPKRAITNDLLGGRAQKRKQHTPQVGRNSQSPQRRAIRGNPRVNRHVSRSTGVHIHV